LELTVQSGPIGHGRAQRAREYSAWLGMVLFLATWTMVFAGLFFAYAGIRLKEPVWPPPGDPRLPLALPGVNTAILFASSLTLSRGIARLRSGLASQFPKWLMATIALGLVFLALQLWVWRAIGLAGLHIATDNYGGVFYGLTCFHALHVAAGLILLGIVAVPALARRNLTRHYGAVRLVGMFWHFVDAVWLLMFLTVYVL
jgi:cytochrome c oxidase subunit 3